MLTIEEIKKRRIEGKRKWGNSLILLLKDKLDEDLPIDVIAQYLEETYSFSLKVGDLYQLKAKYYIPDTEINLSIRSTNSQQSTFKATNTTIEPNSDAEEMYQAIYKPENQKIAFDLGKDF
jgi:hypothetical protein